jgi:cell division protein FtsW (lipid II flippase)
MSWIGYPLFNLIPNEKHVIKISCILFLAKQLTNITSAREKPKLKSHVHKTVISLMIPLHQIVADSYNIT